MNFHFHNKCRPTTCFKHYNAHKFILFTVYPPSTFLVHTVSIYPSAIWCHFCLTWGIRVINHIALLQLWTAGVSIWGWVTAWRQKLASTSLHCPCHIIIGWKPALGKDIIRCVQAGLAYLGQNPSIAARQCPHFHLLCVVRRASWEMKMRVMPVARKRPGMGALTTSIMYYNDSVTPGLNIGVTTRHRHRIIVRT